MCRDTSMDMPIDVCKHLMNVMMDFPITAMLNALPHVCRHAHKHVCGCVNVNVPRYVDAHVYTHVCTHVDTHALSVHMPRSMPIDMKNENYEKKMQH